MKEEKWNGLKERRGTVEAAARVYIRSAESLSSLWGSP